METLEQTRIKLETFISESFPDADIAPGSVLSELLVKLASVVNNTTVNDIANVSTGKYISDVLQMDGDTYYETVDKVASNYNVVRNQGRKVTGKIKVTVSSTGIYFLPAGFIFVQPNLTFKYITTQNFEVRPLADNSLIPEGTLKLYQQGELFYFIVPVEASEAGVEQGLTQNNTQVSNLTRFNLDESSQLDNFVQAEAYGNFTSGQNKETDKELIFRFREGLANKSVASPKSLEAILRQNFNFLKSISVVGATDIELKRNKQNIFGISTLGMADIYVRTSDTIETTNVTISAKLKDNTIPGTTRWVATINSKVVPGFYKIVSVKPISDELTSGTLEVKNLSFDFELTDSRNNFIYTGLDARFSKYQTCTFEFDYATTNYNVGANIGKEFDCLIAYTPSVQDIQDFLLSDANRIISADYLVKAVIPCEVSLKLKLYKKYPLDEIPVADIKRDIFSYINNIPFGEDLIFSKLIDICHNYDIKRVDLPSLMTGVILVPGVGRQEVVTITGQDALVIPSLPDKGISNKNTAFFINYLREDGQTDNIGIELI